jgi:hypothetical protein
MGLNLPALPEGICLHDTAAETCECMRAPLLTHMPACPCAVLPTCAGETEEQYLATEELVRHIGFDRVNTAAYSPRPNTPAAEWDNQVGTGSLSGHLPQQSIADPVHLSSAHFFVVLLLLCSACAACSLTLTVHTQDLASPRVPSSHHRTRPHASPVDQTINHRLLT